MATTLPTEDKMHGSIFVLLKRFIESTFDYSTWLKLTKEAGVENPVYQMKEMYPTRELFTVLELASQQTSEDAYNLMEKFGEFLVPDLLLVYKKYVQPEWRTYEMLLYTEEAMHGAVKREDARTSPPKLLVTKKGKNQLIVDYYSKRRMDALAIGIIKGIAYYYNESDKVLVNRTTAPGEERVQIKVDFLD